MKRLLLNTKVSKIYIISVILITLLLLTSYFSYAMFTVTKEKNNAISIVTGTLSYDLKVDGVSTDELVVGPNEEKTFTITLSNPNNRLARFNFYYITPIFENIEMGYLKIKDFNIPPEETGVNLEKEGIGASQIYQLKVINNNNEQIVINLGVEVGLDYNDLALPSNGNLFEEIFTVNTPELDNNMIPVIYENNNWVKTDEANWYNYDKGEWANAVTVSSSTRDTYLEADIGTVISMDDIETMWVWIPRYSYSIGSEDGINYYGKQGNFLTTMPTQELPGEIDIKFIEPNVKDKGTAKYLVSEGIGADDWYTPDAFTFDGKELSGIWVGKFESSSSNIEALESGIDSMNLDVMIKPNVSSWDNINVATMFQVSLKMNNPGNRYGFSTDVDTHMIKNSEWAIITYLSQSKYGKLGNVNFTGANKEVYQNKSDEIITGCSLGAPSGGTSADYGCQYTYDVDINGTGASTTGTIYGVYDMSGGAFELVMANYNGLVENSGFETMPESKYYDKYTSDDVLTSCSGNACISHGLGENWGWYNDIKELVDANNAWQGRGGAFISSIQGGIFYFDNYDDNGIAAYGLTFRVTLVNLQ
ncbi:MAG TPA: hypothetical protein IAB45_06135 [Candidatus Onthousia faecavium]|nr:hypothetical protein [Candidatus Onthousia faecavium]